MKKICGLSSTRDKNGLGVDRYMRKRIINGNTSKAKMFSLGGGRYALNAIDGVACTLTGAHHYAGNITHPRQGFREMGVLEIYDEENNNI